MGGGTCGVSGQLGIIDCPHDLIRRLPFRKKLGDQRVSNAGFGDYLLHGLVSDEGERAISGW
jgi:hypothetical protein